LLPLNFFICAPLHFVTGVSSLVGGGPQIEVAKS